MFKFFFLIDLMSASGGKTLAKRITEVFECEIIRCTFKLFSVRIYVIFQLN